MNEKQIEYRRAIEALRSGVPNRDAVQALGCHQPSIEERFRDQLRAAREGITKEVQAPGLLITGDFGSGKSHLLEYLHHIALEENFICSKVVISKETPLHDPLKLYRSAIHAAAVPDKRGSVMTEVAWKLGSRKSAYVELDKWVRTHQANLNTRFALTLSLFEHCENMEILNRIISFWSGDPLGAGEIRRWLKDCGEKAKYKIEKVKLIDLAIQWFQFAPRLMVAAGYAGWVLLIDETELIGRYSKLQRAKSYLELARLMGKWPGQQFTGLTSAFALMSIFENRILEGKNDLVAIPRILNDRGREDLAKIAERSMWMIQSEKMQLRDPDHNLIRNTHDKLRDIYAVAYNWQPPPAQYERGFMVMRRHVKHCIWEWDLKRIYPDYIPEIETTEIPTTDFNEDLNL